MKYAYDEAKKEAFIALKKHLGKKFPISADMLTSPPKPEYGDISFACFALANGLGRNPAEVAMELAAKIGPSTLIKKITALGPYVNFTFDDEAFGNRVLADIMRAKKRYGQGNTGNKKHILLEYANLNTHKLPHIGHARNLAIGQSMVNILRANGYKVTPVAYINDLGSNVAKCLWGIMHIEPNTEPAAEDRLAFLDRMYVAANATLEIQEEKRVEVSAIQRDLENMEGPIVALWKKTQKWSAEGLLAFFKMWDLELEKIYWEHDFIEQTHSIVKKLLTEGIAKVSEGAIIVDLTEEHRGVNLLRKTDGTLLYNAKDLALAYKKEEDYAADRSIYVIDTRQSLALEQLASTLKRMDFPREVVHLGYEFVTLPEGAMSSRKGNTIFFSEVFKEAVARCTKEMEERHADWSEKKKAKVSKEIAMSSLKFAMLRQESMRPITFVIDEILSFEGKTAPYLLYSAARIQSLLKKVGEKSLPEARYLTHPVEKSLIRTLAKFPAILLQAGQESRPTILTEYLFTLAQECSRYYELVPVAKEENADTRKARLALYENTLRVLENGLALLGIPTLNEM